MNDNIDLEKEYGDDMIALSAESGLLGMFETSTLKEFLKKLSERQNKTKEDEAVIEVIKAMIKHRSKE